ncbi:hemerythrin domain-containing protein [Virgibacillus sp. W0181]|uniref:hemerythrin domain-containing protein n=1 Tax=Virgibacillus sp. W0181 TaxID=3391581 RepID=UPI003F473D00
MSGPGLKHIDSHSAIHEAALNEAIELNDILEALLKNNELEKALETAYVVVEHWESRTLQHATAEENGLYKDLVEESPELKDKITALTRDHDILRILIDEIKDMLDEGGFSDAVLQRFQSLVLVDIIHNREEERILPHH